MTLYGILGIRESASEKEIDEAYKKMLFIYNPEVKKDAYTFSVNKSILSAYNTITKRKQT
jgi:DnaJ-class molecular chaperone